MKSKASYFSVSKPLIIENMRRFWAIPALAFLVYFLSGVFPILMSYSHLNDMAGYIDMSLSNQQPFYMFAHLMFPVITAVVIFKYLQGISSVSVMHSLPFTRGKLYNSSFLTGLILIAAPILANGLILLAISKPVYRQYGTENGMVTESINLFARADILNWIWVSLLIAFVIYAISVFAGIVTGNSLMHFATAIWFNFLIPALYGVFIVYFSQYLFGFDTSGNWEVYGMRISPFLNILQTDGKFGAGSTVYYILNFLILYGITAFLYRKRKLERATDSLAFSFMEPVICYLIAFFGMTLIGFYFQVLGQSSSLYLYSGFAAGTVIFFILGRMIVRKTPRIYNLKSLKSLGVYALIAILFLLGLNFDVTGFEKRVPAEKDIESFIIAERFTNNGGFDVQYRNGRSYYNGIKTQDEFRLKDPKNIQAVRELHQSIVNNKEWFERSAYSLYTTSLYLSYNPDSAFSATRRYQIDYNFYKDSPQLKTIYESDEFKSYFAPSNLSGAGLTEITVGTDIPNRDRLILNRQAEMREFIDCLDRDFKAQTFEDMASLKAPYGVANIEFSFRDENSDTPARLMYNSASFTITKSWKNTIQWLEAHGYGDHFVHDVREIQFIELYHHVEGRDAVDGPVAIIGGADGPTEMYVAENGKKGSPDQLKSLTVSDPEKIRELIDTYESRNIDYNDFYYGSVVYKKGSGIFQDPEEFYKEYGYGPDAIEKYGAYQSTAEGENVAMMQIYFNEGNIPDYVLEYFK